MMIAIICCLRVLSLDVCVCWSVVVVGLVLSLSHGHPSGSLCVGSLNLSMPTNCRNSEKLSQLPDIIIGSNKTDILQI
jgi:hypothetical protein